MILINLLLQHSCRAAAILSPPFAGMQALPHLFSLTFAEQEQQIPQHSLCINQGWVELVLLYLYFMDS